MNQMEVTVKRVNLLEKLRANREQHRKIFEEALEGYKVKVIEVLEQRLEEAKAGKRYNACINLTQPVDQTREYDRAIAMFDMSVDDEVTLSERQFQCLVLDDWDWKRNFIFSNAAYSEIATRMSEDYS